METTDQNTEYRYQENQVDWNKLSDLGISKDRLEKLNLMEPLLKGYKTKETVPLTLKMGNAIVKLDARLSLQTNDEGNILIAMHGIRKEPNLNYTFFGHEFSKEDKENLLKSGNMGRVVDLYNQKSGENIPSLISIDRKTNEIIAYPSEWVKIPDEIKGVKLDEEQKLNLHEGRAVYVEGMISKKGLPFNAEIQFNADKRFVEFLFDNKNLKQTKNQPLDSDNSIHKNGTNTTQKDEKQNKLKTLNENSKVKSQKSKGRKM